MKKSIPVTFFKFLMGSIVLLSAINSKIYAQAVNPFGCNGSYYVTYGNGTDPTSSTSIDKVTYSGGNITAALQGTTNNYGFNGADINPIDGFMYGIRYSNSGTVSLIKIDTSANVTVVGNLPSFVNGAESVYSGCFDANGDFYIGNLPDAGVASNIYKVNVADASAVLVGSTGLLPDDPTGQLFFVDIAIDPTTGIMYGASNYCCNETGTSSKALYTIDKTTGIATEIGQFTTVAGFQTTGYGLFFSGNGDLFLYGTDANFYFVDKTTAQITAIGNGSSYTFADGCGCSYRVDHTLASSLPAICLSDPAATANVVFTETFINDRGAEVTGAAYHLDLDPRFQFTQSASDVKNELLGLGIATSATTVTISGINGGNNNSIDILPVNIPYTGQGTKTPFTLNALFTNSAGTPSISIASRIYDLPAIIGSQVSSDNPLTLIPNDSTTIGLCNGAPLPVTFVSLNATPDAGGNISVQWQTADEINVLNYEIGRSTDGVHFTVVGKIAATNAGKYSFTDKSVPAGKLFYRVESIDVSGKTAFTPIVVVSTTQKQFAITVTPNPFQQNLQLQILSSKTQTAEVRIFGAAGKLYQNYQLNVQKGASVASLNNTAELPAGIYAIFVNMMGTGDIYSQKIIKQ
jgi:hypothetical protein